MPPPPQLSQAQQEGVAEILARMQMMPKLAGDTDQNSPAAEQQFALKPQEMIVTSPEEAEPQLPEENVQAMKLEPESFPPGAATESVGQVLPEQGAGGDVQDYMNSLLQRLNGGGAIQSAAETKPQQPVVQKQQQPDSEDESVQEFVPPEMPLRAEEFVPKRVAPEIKSDLAAMRELANSTTRNAVMSSEMRRQKAKANTQLLAAGGGIAGAAVFASLSHDMGDMFFCLAVACLLTSAACSFFFVKVNVLGANDSGS